MNHSPLPANQPERNPLPILLVSRGLFHPHPFARRVLRTTLDTIPHVHINPVRGLDSLTSADLHEYRAAVLYFHARSIAPAALEALQNYLQAGGGLLAVHAAAASFKDSQVYFELLGGRFVSHGAVQQITITAQPQSVPLFGELPDFSIHDEFYRMETREDISILFSARQGELEEPFAWTRQHGNGRVFYLAAGHTAASLRHPAVQRIVRRGLLWCAGQLSHGQENETDG